MTDKPLPPDNLIDVHARLRWAREMQGYSSPRKAAHALGLPVESLRKHESGERGKGGLKEEHIRRYAKKFKVEPTWLATGSGSPFGVTAEQLTAEEARLIAAFRASKESA